MWTNEPLHGPTPKLEESRSRRLWLEALDCVDKARREEMRVLVETAVSTSGGGARFRALAARLLLLAADFDGALEAIAGAEASASTPVERRSAAVAHAFAVGTLGDFAAASAALENILTAESHITLLFSAMELSVNVKDSESALRWARRIVRHPDATAEHRLRAADALHRVGCDEHALALIREVLGPSAQQCVDTCRAAQLLLACRACEEAGELFRAQIAASDNQLDAHIGLATIHLWSGQTRDAELHARRALSLKGDRGVSDRILAAVALLEGRIREALDALNSLAAKMPTDAETRLWRAEALLRCGQPREALIELQEALDLRAGDERDVVIAVIDALAMLRCGRRPKADLMLLRAVDAACKTVQPPAAHERNSLTYLRMRRFVRRVFPISIDRLLSVASRPLRRAGVPVPEVDGPAVIESILESVLTQFGGNRSTTPTLTSAGKLSPLVVAPPPRAEVQAALYSVRIGGYPEARRRLELLMERYPGWPHPWFYRAELLMWLGLLDDARCDLEVAIRKLRTRDPEMDRAKWPPIGLAGVHLLQGRPREALRTLERGGRSSGAPAPPYFAWYGEILRRLGRLEEARGALEQVCQPGSTRLGSLITLALTYRDLGDRDRPREILANLVDQAPGLMIDVTGNAPEERFRMALAPGALERLSDDETHELLERALVAMRGNRSASCLTFVDFGNRLRVIPPRGFYRFVNRTEEVHNLRAEVTELLCSPQ